MEDGSAFLAKPRLRLLLDHFSKIKDTRRTHELTTSWYRQLLKQIGSDILTAPKNLWRRTMRRFMALLVTEITFVDDPRETDAQAQNYEQHLAEELQKAANALSLRTIKGNNVAKVQVTEIKDLISL
jgi:hypothetical protein